MRMMYITYIYIYIHTCERRKNWKSYGNIGKTKNNQGKHRKAKEKPRKNQGQIRQTFILQAFHKFSEAFHGLILGICSFILQGFCIPSVFRCSCKYIIFIKP